MSMVHKDNREVYLHHYDEAVQILDDAWDDGKWGEAKEAIASAQVHATLALAVAVTRMVDDYNGWKDIKN